MPVDYVKIPATFIERLADDPATRAVVEAVVKVAHALGKHVIAEGVETAEVAAEVSRVDIEYAQGYLWGPAVRQDAPVRRVLLETAG